MAHRLFNFKGLPVEIFVSICEFFCPHCLELVYKGDQGTLARLCQVSRLFRDIAQPVLFHYYRGSRGASRRSILYTVSQQPFLAANVRVLNLTEDRLSSRDQLFESDQDACYLENVAERLYIEPGWADMSSNIYKADEQYYSECIEEITADMLITSLPNLRQLGLQWDNYRNLSTLTSALQNGLWAGLPFLQYLQLDHWDTVGFFNASSIRGLLRAAPNIETLSIQMCSFYDSSICVDYSVKETFPVLQSLQTLELSETSIGPSGLAIFEQFIAACPSLKRLNLVAAHGECAWAAPAEVMYALQVSSITLRSLFMDFRGAGIDTPCRGQIRSLRGFSCLEDLAIDLRLFCTNDADDLYPYNYDSQTHDDDCLTRILPQSVHTVQLLSHEKEGPCEQDLYRLGYECLKGGFPRLKSLTMSGTYEEPGEIPSSLFELFQSAGVELKSLRDGSSNMM